MSSARLPTFLVIGAMKAGTTSLYQYLREHPQVFMSAQKELDYFPPGIHWGYGLSWYQSHFADAGDAVAVGEASPTYAHDPLHQHIPERIHQLLPDVRLVYLIREPIDRIQSHYRHRVKYERETHPPTIELLEGLTYLPQSMYAHQIECYLEWFPREQLLVVQAERLRDRRAETYEEILRFIGVDETHVPATLGTEYLRSVGAPRTMRDRALSRTRALLGTRDPTALSTETRLELRDLLIDDVRRLPDHLGPEFDAWGWV